jgi:hypothetical protein
MNTPLLSLAWAQCHGVVVQHIIEVLIFKGNIKRASCLHWVKYLRG